MLEIKHKYMDSKMRIYFLVIFLITFIPISSAEKLEHGHVNGPSFNCSKATTKSEKEICSNKYISAQDLYLSYLFSKIKNKNETREQRQWLRQRDNCSLSHPMQGYGTTALQACLADRIIVLEKKATLEYKDYLTLSKIFNFEKQKKNTPAEKHIFSINMKKYLEGLNNGHCNFTPEKIIFQSEKYIVSDVHGSRTCSGRSIELDYRKYYCQDKIGNYIDGDIYTCNNKHVSNLAMDVITDTISSIDKEITSDWEKASKNPITKYIFSLPIHMLSNNDGIYRKPVIEKLINNYNLISEKLEIEQHWVQSAIDGMTCTHNIVFTKENWKKILAEKPFDYRFKGDYWYGRQFEGCQDYEKHISGEWYTEKEAYIYIWKKLNENNSAELAREFLKNKFNKKLSTPKVTDQTLNIQS